MIKVSQEAEKKIIELMKESGFDNPLSSWNYIRIFRGLER